MIAACLCIVCTGARHRIGHGARLLASQQRQDNMDSSLAFDPQQWNPIHVQQSTGKSVHLVFARILMPITQFVVCWLQRAELLAN